MFTNIKSALALAIALLVANSVNAQFVQIAEVNFDDLPAVNFPLAATFTSGGVDISVNNGGFGFAGPGVQIGNPAPPFVLASNPHVATPNNVGMDFHMATVPGPTSLITFDYFNQGGDVTMEINGALIGPILNYPGTFVLGGSTVSNSFSVVGGNILGSVKIESTGGINSFMVGGQETQFDNFKFFMFGLLGDVNCDGEVNLLDIDPFVELINNGEYNPKADFNGDGEVNLLDVGDFVEALG